HQGLGDVCEHQGDLAGARKHYARMHLLLKAIRTSAPDSERARQDLWAAAHRMADVCLSLRDPAAGRDYIREPLPALQKLVKARPKDMEVRYELSASYAKLGAILDALGEYPEAERVVLAGVDLVKALADEFPSIPAYRQDLAENHLHLSALLLKAG